MSDWEACRQRAVPKGLQALDYTAVLLLVPEIAQCRCSIYPARVCGVFLGLYRTSKLWAWSGEEFSIAVWYRWSALFRLVGLCLKLVSSASSIQGQCLCSSSFEYQNTVSCIGFKDSVCLLSSAPTQPPCLWKWCSRTTLALSSPNLISFSVLCILGFALLTYLWMFLFFHTLLGVCHSFFFLFLGLFPIQLWHFLGSVWDASPSLFTLLVLGHILSLLFLESSFIPLWQKLQVLSRSKALTGQWAIQASGCQ